MVEILNEIIDVFEPDRNTQESFRGAGARPFDRSAMFDKALYSSQACSAGKDFHPGRHLHGSFLTVLNLKRQHASKSFHLTSRDRVPRALRQPRIVNSGNARVVA